MIDDPGYVKRSIVIDVLLRNGVAVSVDPTGGPEMMVLIKGDKVDARRIPEEVPRRVLQYLKRHFNIPIHHFYNPLMAPNLPNEKIQ
jgi:hypothetical protein